jgi:hypothetical protein
MGRGLGVRGHKRIVAPAGEKIRKNRVCPFTCGWNLSCACGWYGGHFPNNTAADIAYSAHIKAILAELFTCETCGGQYDISKMRKDYRYMCKRCGNKKGNAWQKQNTEASQHHKRRHYYRNTYGITIEEFDALLASQEGTCAICRRKIMDPRGYHPHVDHDHITGKVRGVLCFSCNIGLGGFKDNAEFLRAAIDYLEHHAKPIPFQGRTRIFQCT